MTQFNPVWKVTVGGYEYTTAILSNLTITSGRTNIYEQGYSFGQMEAGLYILEIKSHDTISITKKIIIAN